MDCLTISKVELARERYDVQHECTTLKIHVRFPDHIFRQADLVREDAISLEQFLVHLMPALPRESVAQILAAAVATRLTR